MPHIDCCNEMHHAQTQGTDTEGYAPLVYYDRVFRGFITGSSLPPLKFCPWCGKHVAVGPT